MTSISRTHCKLFAQVIATSLIAGMSITVFGASPGAAHSTEQQVQPLAQDVRFPIHHYNICNAVAHNPDNAACNPTQGVQAQNILVWQSAVESSWFISVNEVCMSDAQELSRRLGADGWIVFSLQEAQHCDPNPPPGEPRDQRFGNAIFYPGGVLEEVYLDYLPNPGRDCSVPTVECRTMICLELGSFAGLWNQCTAHLVSGSASLEERRDQASYYVDQASYFANLSGYLSLAGDFNLEPNDMPDVCDVAPGCYDGFNDFVVGDTHEIRPNGPPSRHIDYIWVEDELVPGRYFARCSGAFADGSDHCWTKAEVSVLR